MNQNSKLRGSIVTDDNYDGSFRICNNINLVFKLTCSYIKLAISYKEVHAKVSQPAVSSQKMHWLVLSAYICPYLSLSIVCVCVCVCAGDK
jgi:hypothetical protein